MKSEQMAAQDSILDWLADDLELNIQDPEEIQTALVGRVEIWKTYCDFCAATKRTPKARRTFNAMMKSYFGIGARRTRQGGDHVWVAVRE